MENSEDIIPEQETNSNNPSETTKIEEITPVEIAIPNTDTELEKEPIEEKTIAIDPREKARLTRVINEFKNDTQKLIEEFKESTTKILESSKESEVVKNKLNIAFTDIEAKLKTADEQSAKISELHTEIFKSTEENDSIEDDIKEAERTISEASDSVQAKKKEFDEYHSRIFGSKDESGNEVAGLKQEIEKNKNTLEELHKKETEKFKTLFEKIEGLLPGATTAGLAMAFANQKKNYHWPNKLWSSVFVLTMIGMAWFGISTLKDITEATKATPLSISLVLSIILARTPFFIATIWLGIFASKQQSQNKRLEQEYAHKENTAKSYEGFKRQIDSLEQSDDNKDLSMKLLENMVVSMSYNPSSTLENASHREEPPIIEKALNFITSSEKIIPGSDNLK